MEDDGVEVRQMATAFLINQEHVLMMKKARSKLLISSFGEALVGISNMKN